MRLLLSNPPPPPLRKELVSSLLAAQMSLVQGGVLKKSSDYIYSSATNYLYGSGLVEIEKMENPIVDVVMNWSFTKYNSY